jgi:acyl-CoA thioester hydrolase
MGPSDNYAEISFQIKPYDIDAAGHVNNAVYINWLEDLRVKLFSDIVPLESLAKKNIYLVVASTRIKYKAPLFLYDNPEGILKIDHYYKGIWYLSARFILGHQVIAEAEQKCVLIDGKNNKMLKEVVSTYKEMEYEINRC